MEQMNFQQKTADTAFAAFEPPVQPQSADAAMDDEFLRQSVMMDPERCFCRDCGKPVYKNASVCVHCNYVMNAAELQKGASVVNQRREAYQQRHRFRNFIKKYTMLDLETPQEKEHWAVRRQNYRYQTTGSVFCSNCGCEVDPGASVCVKCQYVLNPYAIQQAKMAIEDRNARLSRIDLIKSLLIPGYGKKIYQVYAVRRPQVANPCRIAGIINKALIFGVAAWVIFFS
ncbi:MAG: hypothetical protein MJ071_05840 [Oscillospiraceae bacterium]|nr:hypothetical protein [Oscillospiraceae bacterium]